jgi:hypothetical protein
MGREVKRANRIAAVASAWSDVAAVWNSPSVGPDIVKIKKRIPISLNRAQPFRHLLLDLPNQGRQLLGLDESLL